MRKLAFMVCLVAVLVSGLICQPGWAGEYPDRTIEFINTGTAGSGIDLTNRLLADYLSKDLKQTVIVTNKPGGAFTLGLDVVARSKPDGYTLGYAGVASLVHVRAIDPKMMPYDPEKDLTPLGIHCFLSYVIAVREDAPWKTFEEFIEYAKQNPKKIRISTAASGSVASFALYVIQSLAGFELTEVPGKGGTQTETMVLGGHVEATIDILGKVLPFVQSKEMRMLLTTKKLKEFLEVPTLKELGYKQDAPTGWFGIFGPANMPDEAKKVLVPAIRKAVEDPETSEKLAKLYYISDYKTPEEQLAMIQEEYKEAVVLSEKMGIRKKQLAFEFVVYRPGAGHPEIHMV